MKKIKGKHCVIAGGVLCGIGILFFGIGMAFGGKEYVKNADLNQMNGKAMLDSKQEAFSGEETFEDLTGIQADLKNIDLLIKPSEDEKFHLTYNLEKSGKGKNPLSFEQKDGLLTIKESEGNGGSYYIKVDISIINVLFGNDKVYDYKNEATLYIPERKILDKASINLENGDFYADGFAAETAEIRLEYGDIIMQNISLNKGNITAEDGDISADKGLLKDLDMKAKYGDIMLKNTQYENGKITLEDGDLNSSEISFTGDTDIVNKYGDVSLKLSKETANDTSIEAKTEYGEIDISENLKKTAGKFMENEDMIYFEKEGLQGSGKISVEAEDGDISIQ